MSVSTNNLFPLSPRSCETILEKHPDDRLHSATVYNSQKQDTATYRSHILTYSSRSSPLHHNSQTSSQTRHHHGQAAVCQLGSKLGFAGLRVLDLAQESGEAHAIVARLSCLSRVLHGELALTRPTAIGSGCCLEEASGLDQTAESDDLSPSKDGDPKQVL